MEKDNLQKLVAFGTFVVLALLLFNLFNILGMESQLEEKVIEIKELARPANLELTIIKTTDCVGCFDISSVIKEIKGANVNITREIVLDAAVSKDSKTIKEIVDKYGIKKLPAIVLKGDINKTSFQGFEQRGDALVFETITPPYVDAKTGKIIGKVEAVIITDKSCKLCYNYSTLIESLKQGGVIFSEIMKLNFNSTEAKELITKYKINRIPALILSADIDAYQISQTLKQTGMQAKSDRYVFEPYPPYIETDSGKLRGLVILTMVNDSTCGECYNVSLHRQILARFGLAITEEKVIDTNSKEGQELVAMYNITKVPTIIITGDVDVYEAFKKVWQQVGTIEKDGAYVFRNMKALAGFKYKDLTTNEVKSA